jgi:hypothetical protein
MGLAFSYTKIREKHLKRRNLRVIVLINAQAEFLNKTLAN